MPNDSALTQAASNLAISNFQLSPFNFHLMTTQPFPRRSLTFPPNASRRTRLSPALLATGIALSGGLLADRSLAASRADAIAWGTAQAISGDSDVRTDGSLVSAFNFGSAGVANSTVNGVLFEAFAFPEDMTGDTFNLGPLTFSGTAGLLVSSNGLGAATGSFASLSGSYQTLLGSGGSASNPGASFYLKMDGLTIGQEYLLQWWSNNSANSSLVTETIGLSDTGEVTLDSNTSDAAGGLGQYAVGTFTAERSSVRFELEGTAGNPLINAVQLREVSAVPEPGSLVTLATLGAAGALGRRRRKA